MDKLTFKPLAASFAEELMSVWSDMDVIRYTNIEKPCTMDEIKERIVLLKSQDVFVVFRENEVLGIIGCPCMDKLKSQYGVFYQFKKSCWGKGYATASAKWLIDFMANKYGCISIMAEVIADNVASEKILKQLGFQFISEDECQCKGKNMPIRSYEKNICLGLD